MPSAITWRAFNRVNKFLPLREENGKHKANCIVLNVVDCTDKGIANFR